MGTQKDGEVWLSDDPHKIEASKEEDVVILYLSGCCFVSREH